MSSGEFAEADARLAGMHGYEPALLRCEVHAVPMYATEHADEAYCPWCRIDALEARCVTR